jgi:exocyst complex component 4
MKEDSDNVPNTILFPANQEYLVKRTSLNMSTTLIYQVPSITWKVFPINTILTLGLDWLNGALSNSSNVHPESDSFNYIKNVVLALHSLSQVHRAMDSLTQRLPLEVYQLVQRTIFEVESRHFADVRNMNNVRREQRSFDGFAKSEANSEVIADLLWTLYSKLAAVLSGHRIVHDCVLAIVKESKNRENLSDTPEYNYIEVWKPIQSEVT